jgi:hypothetical protein
MYIAVGKLSFDDCGMSMWSFGCTGAFPPRAVRVIRQQRLEITSLTFMLSCVPLLPIE